MGVIVVVLPKLENAKKVKKILLEHGFQTVFACSSASSALQMVGEYSYGLVISGYRMPDMYYLDLVDCLPRDFESILLGSEETVAQVGAGILSLTMPIKAMIWSIPQIWCFVSWSGGSKRKPGHPKNGVRRNRIISVMQNFC